MAEIGKADHAAPADAQHLADQRCRRVNLLQRLGKDDDIEGIVRIIPDFIVDVPLQHGESPFDAAGHAGLVDVDTGTVRPFMGLQVVQQGAVAASQAQDPRAVGDPGRHQTQVIANSVGVMIDRCHLPEILS